MKYAIAAINAFCCMAVKSEVLTTLSILFWLLYIVLGAMLEGVKEREEKTVFTDDTAFAYWLATPRYGVYKKK